MTCPGCGDKMDTTWSIYGGIKIDYWICYGCRVDGCKFWPANQESKDSLVEEHTDWFLDMMFVIFEEGAKKQFNKSEVLTIMRKVYHDCMLHGYKHGYEDGLCSHDTCIAHRYRKIPIHCMCDRCGNPVGPEEKYCSEECATEGENDD